MKENTLDNQPQLFGHPIGLYVLFFTEMWERFSYYGMRAILILYLTSTTLGDNAGLGWDKVDALALYGWYTMLVYVASIPGGIIADKLLGQKKSVMLGGLILCFGHGILAVTATWAFYTGLGLIIAGVGLLKPNISTMVGGLYEPGDERRDKGFTIFYIGINLGAFLATIIVGFVAEKVGWHYGFGLAGIGMVLGQLVFMWGQKYLVGVGDKIDDSEDGTGSLDLVMRIFSSLNSMLLFGLGMALSVYLFVKGSWDYGLLWIFLAFAFGIAAVIYNEGTRIEKDRSIVLYVSFFLIIIFWGAFEQAGGLMNLYAEEKTNRMLGGFEVPTTWFQSLNSLYIMFFGMSVAAIWHKVKLRGGESSSLFKMAVGIVIMGFGFIFMRFAAQEFEATGSSAMYWLVLAYLFHTIGELCASPVALSFITKLAPVKYVSFMMGAYFAASGLGNKVAGMIGEKAIEAGEISTFTGIFIFTLIVGIAVLFVLKPLKRLTHGAEDLVVDVGH